MVQQTKNPAIHFIWTESKCVVAQHTPAPCGAIKCRTTLHLYAHTDYYFKVQAILKYQCGFLLDPLAKFATWTFCHQVVSVLYIHRCNINVHMFDAKICNVSWSTGKWGCCIKRISAGFVTYELQFFRYEYNRIKKYSGLMVFLFYQARNIYTDMVDT